KNRLYYPKRIKGLFFIDILFLTQNPEADDRSQLTLYLAARQLVSKIIFEKSPCCALTLFHVCGRNIWRRMESSFEQSRYYTLAVDVVSGLRIKRQPSDGKLRDLWAKVLVLEDSVGSKAVLITADIIGFPREFAFRIRKALYKNHGLTDAQVIFNSSHTHSVPVLKDVLRDYYARPLDAEQIQRIEDYTDELEEKIVKAVAEAM